MRVTHIPALLIFLEMGRDWTGVSGMKWAFQSKFLAKQFFVQMPSIQKNMKDMLRHF